MKHKRGCPEGCTDDLYFGAIDPRADGQVRLAFCHQHAEPTRQEWQNAGYQNAKLYLLETSGPWYEEQPVEVTHQPEGDNADDEERGEEGTDE